MGQAFFVDNSLDSVEGLRPRKHEPCRFATSLLITGVAL